MSFGSKPSVSITQTADILVNFPAGAHEYLTTGNARILAQDLVRAADAIDAARAEVHSEKLANDCSRIQGEYLK